MAFKFVVALALVAVASAGFVASPQVYHAGPAVAVAQPVLAKNVEEYDPHPQYKFSYDVQDSITGDTKSQVESRDGDVVQGEYSLIDADGYKRTVQYTADPVHGFNAIVNREPLGVAVKAVAPVVKTITPVSYAAPALIKSAPLAYTAAPSLIRSGPVAYGAGPALIKSAPLAYAAGPALAYHH